MKRAVVTGPTGAVGMALIKELADNGVVVTAVCREGSSRRAQIEESERVRVVECSLDNLNSLDKLIEDEQDAFYHLAWEGTYGESRNDVKLQNRNVDYTLDAVNAAYRLGCKVFVGAGSQAEYGRVEGELNGSVPTFPENGYGIGKLCAGQLSRIMCQQRGIRHIWARILSVYGPYDGRYTMISSTIGKLLDGHVPPLTKGEQEWDYLYSGDAARALRLLGEKGRDGGVYCLGSGQAEPLGEYIKILRDIAAPGAELGFGQVPYGDKQVFFLKADISDLVRDTGYTPDTPFEEGIRKTIEWYKETI